MTGQPLTILRPFPLAHSVELWRWLNDPRDPNFDDYGPRDQAGFRTWLEQRIAGEWTWQIRLGTQIVGYLAFMLQTPVSGMFHGLVIAPQYRHQRIGTFAVKQAIHELRKAGVEKFMVWTFADNAPIRSLFAGLDFVQEGYVTGATRRNGKPLDMRVLCLPGVKGDELCRSVDC
jgi:RimJ/RimL family protein N-acetyltransferase